MSGAQSARHRSPNAPAIVEKTTGFPEQSEHCVPGRTDGRRPLSMAWISDELLAETIEVWSEQYGRRIDVDEAVEILVNVKRLAQALIRAKQEAKI